MLIPIFTLYARELQGATPWLLGFALGAYGLTQGLFQIPFGMLSDRFGRKPLITLGLVLFAIGSLVGALSHSITGMIIARILQGSGAIGSVLIALLADLTSERDRTKAMAVIGVTIGLSFSLAMVLSPAITEIAGLSGVFYFSVVLAITGLIMLHTVIPNAPSSPLQRNDTVNIRQLKQVFMDPNLQRLNAGIFFLHFMLVSTFYALPLILQTYIQQHTLSQSWHFYLPLMIGSFLVMIPLLLITEKKGRIKTLFIGAVSLILCAEIGLAWLPPTFISLCGLMFIYFLAFNLLEASLPSLISKQANPQTKGCAMGIYSSCQFLGIFIGGSLAGIVFQQAGFRGIFLMNGGIAVLWLIITLFMNVGPSQDKK